MVRKYGYKKDKNTNDLWLREINTEANFVHIGKGFFSCTLIVLILIDYCAGLIVTEALSVLVMKS